MKYSLLLLPSLALSQNYELEKIVVGSKRDISEDVYTGEVDSITDFTSAGNEKVLDELQQLPGVSISQAGAPGQQASIFIRGSEARHVLVLVDGVRINDPSNTDKFFNGALLNVGDIEKVEVLKGSQTLLYGSEAMGGVVNIITKKANPKNYVQLYSGFSQGIELDNTFIAGDSVFHTHFFHESAEGISAAESGDEKDGFQNKGATLNFSRRFSKAFEGEWTYKVLDQFVETDTIDFTTYKPVDADDDYSKSVQQIFSQKLKYNTGRSEFTYLLGGNWMDRESESSGFVYSYDGREFTNELRWKLNDEHGSTLFGLENLSETFSTNEIPDEKFAGLTSLIAIRDGQRGNWFYNYGLRASFHTQFGEAYSPGFGVGRKFGDQGEQRVALNYQKGFKSPTLYQLYAPPVFGSPVGNDQLDPETNDYVDLNYSYGNIVNLSLFYNRVDEIIIYDFTQGYANSNFMETYGLEANYEFVFGKNVLRPGVFSAHYNMPDDEKALRRPRQKATVTFERKITDKQQLIIDWEGTGSSYDTVGGNFVQLDSYNIWNVHYRIENGNLLYSAGVENLFDESYEQVYGYSSQPFTAYLKVKYNY